MPYTQDESYYLLDADEDEETYVYLGLKEGVDKKRWSGNSVQQKKEKNVSQWKNMSTKSRSKTRSCADSGGNGALLRKNTMVLEISATPYIFTFKLWDWGRLGMDGLPRPIHLDHGMKNIQWNRDTKWVYDNIVGQTRTMEKQKTVK